MCVDYRDLNTIESILNLFNLFYGNRLGTPVRGRAWDSGADVFSIASVYEYALKFSKNHVFMD